MESSLFGAFGGIVSVFLAAGTAVYFDRSTVVAGLLPPGFRTGVEPEPKPGGESAPDSSARRASLAPRRWAAMALLGVVFWLGVFLPIASLGAPAPDPSQLGRAQLFLLHAILVLTLVLWYLLAFGGRGAWRPSSFLRQFGLRSTKLFKDVGIGLAAGVGAWMAVLLVLILLGMLIWAVGGEEAMPVGPPALVSWIAALPLGLRLALSASAGFAEELFFRGFLQPRAGITFSTVLFVLAHAGYGQPLMMVGVTLLSLVFAALVRWRQNIWAAVVAHAVFDALQLTLVIPKALEFLEAAPVA